MTGSRGLGPGSLRRDGWGRHALSVMPRAVAAFVVVSIALGVSSCGAGGFDSTRWKAVRGGSNDQLRERWEMYQDLSSQHRLVGMTPDDIRALLGEPDQIGNGPFTQDSLPNWAEFKDYNADFVYRYWLGAGGLFPIDSDAMAIYFKNGVVDKFCWHAT